MGLSSRLLAGMMAVSLFLCSCSAPRNPGDMGPVELVMPIGSRITAPSTEGPMSVTAVARFSRAYAWDHVTATFHGEPRTRRWYGGLGISLGSQESGNATPSNAVLEEYQLHYHSLAGVIKDLVPAAGYSARGPRWYWTANGLAVWFSVQRLPQFLSLGANVVQYCVNGEKPRNLPGATAAVRITDANGKPTSTLPCAHVDESGYYDTWEAKQEGH